MTACKKTTGKTGSLLFAGALFAVAAVVTPARAGFAQYSGDNAQLLNRLGQLEKQVQTLSRSVYRGESPPPGAADMAAPLPADASAVSVFETRLSQLEEQQRTLTGQIEEAAWRVQQLQDRLDRMQQDMETRLRYLEGGAGAAGTGAYSRAQEAQAVGSPYMDTGLPPQTLGTLSASGQTPDALYEDAFADIREARYEAAETKFRDFMARYATHPLAANAQYWLGETYYVRGNYEQAAKIFAQGYQDYPKGSKAPDSLLKLGLSLAKMGRKDDACLSFQQLRTQFPGDAAPANRRAAQEMRRLGCS